MVRLGGGHFTGLDSVVDFDPSWEGDFAVEPELAFLHVGSVALDAVAVDEGAKFGGEGEAEGLDEEPDEGEAEHCGKG